MTIERGVGQGMMTAMDRDGRALRLLRWMRRELLPLHWRTRLAIGVFVAVVVLSLTVKALVAVASLF